MIGITTFSIIGFIGFGFYVMDIEDHYGDLQEVFYAAKSGDLILNKTTSDFGRVKKGWNRIQIIKSNNEVYDLYHWVYQDGIKNEIELYTPSKKLTHDKVSYRELTDLIENKNLKLINKY